MGHPFLLQQSWTALFFRGLAAQIVKYGLLWHRAALLLLTPRRADFSRGADKRTAQGVWGATQLQLRGLRLRRYRTTRSWLEGCSGSIIRIAALPGPHQDFAGLHEGPRTRQLTAPGRGLPPVHFRCL